MQRIAGTRLADLLHERVLAPLRMHDTAFVMTPSMWQRLGPVHTRADDGAAVPIEFVLPQETEVDMGGHELYSTAHDYAKFIRAWLNDGEGVDGRILKAETIEAASRNGLGDLKVRELRAVNAFMTRPVNFLFPETTKSWALSFMVTDGPTSTGRSPGTLSWGGSPAHTSGSTVPPESAGSGQVMCCHSATPRPMTRTSHSRLQTFAASAIRRLDGSRPSGHPLSLDPPMGGGYELVSTLDVVCIDGAGLIGGPFCPRVPLMFWVAPASAGSSVWRLVPWPAACVEECAPCGLPGPRRSGDAVSASGRRTRSSPGC